MTTSEMISWFTILEDKFGSAYFTESEHLNFLNRAILDTVSSYLPGAPGTPGVEITSGDLTNIAPLVYEIDSLTMDSNGIITDSAINSVLATEAGDPGSTYMRLLSVGFKKGSKRYPAIFMRHNDKEAHQAAYNYFKNPSYDRPRYILQNNGIKFLPVDNNVTIYITVIKTPKELSVSPEVNTELPEILHNSIVSTAVSYSGVAARDEMLTYLNSQNNTNV